MTQTMFEASLKKLSVIVTRCLRAVSKEFSPYLLTFLFLSKSFISYTDYWSCYITDVGRHGVGSLVYAKASNQ
jgi:hypothetical protein